jgi:hypothetical protein
MKREAYFFLAAVFLTFAFAFVFFTAFFLAAISILHVSG